MVKKNYGGNDYQGFVRQAENRETLNDLVEFLTIFDPDSMKKGSREICYQYEIINSGGTVIIRDKYSGERVFVSGNGLDYFVSCASEELTKRCDGLDYDSWQRLQHAIEKDD